MKKILLSGVALLLPVVAFADTTSSGSTQATSTTVVSTGAMVQKPPMGTGADMEKSMNGLHLAMGQLSQSDGEALMKMIREYLASKGIVMPAYQEVREMHQEVRQMRQDAKEDMKQAREQFRESMKNKREALKLKVRDTRRALMSGSGTTGSGTAQ